MAKKANLSYTFLTHYVLPATNALSSLGIEQQSEFDGIKIHVADDGTVYIIFMVGSEIKMVKSTDGGDSFQATASPATGIGAFGIITLLGGNFRVAQVPTACDSGSTVIVAWSDNREGNVRIYYAVSTNGGTSWNTPPSGQPLLAGLPIDANVFHFHPQIVFRPNGVLGCAFYEFGPKPVTPKIDTRMALSFDNGISFSQLFTVTDQPWDPAVDAPWAHGVSSVTFIGEYFGFDASDNGFYPLWTDTRTGIQELWMDIMPQKTCAFIVERSTFGQDEIDARRKAVPLDDFMIEELLAWYSITPYKKGEDWVFASDSHRAGMKRGKQPYWPSTIMRHFIQPVAKQLGIGNISWHTFRHTYSTLLHANGEDPKVVQELLRHSSIKVTMDVYTQAVTATKRKAQSRVVEMIVPKKPAGVMAPA